MQRPSQVNHSIVSCSKETYLENIQVMVSVGGDQTTTLRGSAWSDAAASTDGKLVLHGGNFLEGTGKRKLKCNRKKVLEFDLTRD